MFLIKVKIIDIWYVIK